MCREDTETPIELMEPDISELNTYMVEALSNPHDPIHGECLLLMNIFDKRGRKAFAKSIDYTITRGVENED